MDKTFLRLTSKTMIITLLSAALIFATCMSALAAPAQAPSVDREASEEAFLKAYSHFIKGRMWSCIDELNIALEKNVYFVDAYYMRSLAYRRLGRYPEAIAEMTYYMEVRQEDQRAGTILDRMNEEWEIIQRSLRIDSDLADHRFTADTMKNMFDLQLTMPLAMRGLQGAGKMTSVGTSVLVCDMFGDALWMFDLEKRHEPICLDIEVPAVCLPMNTTTGMLFQKSGDVSIVRFDIESLSADVIRLGSIDANVSAAAFIDSSLIAVADRTGQAVRFYSSPTLAETGLWRPNDADMIRKLFEPTAIAAYGSAIAVADRANERVHVIDAFTLKERERFDVQEPRDLCWGLEGELYIVSENGTLYKKRSLARENAPLEVVTADLADLWCMTMTPDGPLMTTITGRIWWYSKLNPGYRDTVGAMAIHSPWLEDTTDSEHLMIRAVASSFFQKFIQDKTPDTQSIWRNELRPSRIMEMTASNSSACRVYSPNENNSSPAAKLVRASTLTDVMADLASVSRQGDELPKIIVLDTAITGSDDKMAELMAFLMQNGIRLDIWVISRPASEMMTRISRLTLGNAYYSRTLSAVPPNVRNEWVITIPLPPDTYTFGYPSESTLSIYANIDIIRFADWVPIWPSLLKGE